MTSSNKLNQELQQPPTVRDDKVAAAKALLADGSYPSDAVLGKVANLLATHLQETEG
jgi:anti-sigma28 factor (negative regulator of flagellin synthesis)